MAGVAQDRVDPDRVRDSRMPDAGDRARGAARSPDRRSLGRARRHLQQPGSVHPVSALEAGLQRPCQPDPYRARPWLLPEESRVVNVRSLGFRLAVWYFCTVTAILSLAVTGYWFAVRAGLHDAMDRHLGYRVTGFRQYLEAVDASEDAEVARRLAAISRIGELYEAYDESGALIAQSFTLSKHRMEPQPPLDL